MFNRILENTKKQIDRSGWGGLGSVAVMTLTFLVAIIFGGLAFLSNLWIQFIESRSNILVFFEVGMDQDIIENLQTKWQQNPKIKNINYTSEEQAFALYGDYSAKVQPIQYDALKTNQFINGKLPSSLDIQIYSLNDLEGLSSDIQRDIEEELKSLVITDTDGEDDGITEYKYSVDPTVPPITLRVDSESLDKLREVLNFLRISGIAIISLLFIVIFFFTLMTVEFKLSNQMEEIGVMQLVGGSLTFIRSPYILEGGFYGLLGALVSTLMIGVILISIFVLNSNSTITLFIYENFAKLSWPAITPFGWLGVIAATGFIGFLLGSFSSFLSIRRYIR